MFEGQNLVVFMNGEYVPINEAKISLFDGGFLRSDCVYDTTSAWSGYIFRLDDHVERFYRSMAAVKLGIPYGREEFKQVVIETTRRCNLREAYIQMVATRGEAAPGTAPAAPTVIVFAIPYVWIASPEKQEQGLRVKIASHRRIPHQCLDPKIKSFNWLNLVLALQEGRALGMDNVLMLDINGYLTEGPGFNVFLVRDGQLFTPSEGVLLGITRRTVFELAAQEGIECAEGFLTTADLYTADEAFLSSTAGGVMPVVEIDGRSLGDGRPGPVTARIKAAYWRMREAGVHGTPVFAEQPARA